LRAVPAEAGEFLAAAEIADITPPLHLSLFGHGPESRIATGVRLRLRCEAFVLAAAGEVVALVPCDLQGPSMALQRGIADRLATWGVPISADRLFLMATHTHAGPAHYFESRRYSGPFSSYAPGHDDKVVDFLVNRIATAIATAFGSLKPACIGWGQKDVANLTFNRSYVPFLANREDDLGTLPSDNAFSRAKKAEQATRVSAAQADSGFAGPALTPPESAVDQKLFVLRIDRRLGDGGTCAGGPPLGVFAVFGMHPTGVPNKNQLYHGDIFGFAVRTAEDCLGLATVGDAGFSLAPATGANARACEWDRRVDGDVVVGLANGIEGDVSPRLDMQSVPEARKLGRALGMEIVDAVAAVHTSPAARPLRRVYWDLHFSKGQYDEEPTHLLCQNAELGMAAAGGAPDGPTRLRVIPEANAGFRPDEPSPCHGNKLPLRAGPTSSPYDFPLVAPISLVQVGDGFIAMAPGEMTTMTGLRIRRTLRERLELSDAARPIALVGLTNQYLQYFATREEYDFQYYEGASTLYGPNSSQFLNRHFSCLADVFEGRQTTCRGQPPVNVAEAIAMCPSPIVARWPTEQDVQFVRLDPQDVVCRSRDGGLGWEMEFEPLPLTFSSDRDRFSVQVLQLDPSGSERVIDDDRGSSIEVREVAGARWRVRWIPDLDEQDPRCGRSFRLSVGGRVHFKSRSFLIECRNGPASGCP
jgi:neutral ceramidase